MARTFTSPLKQDAVNHASRGLRKAARIFFLTARICSELKELCIHSIKRYEAGVNLKERLLEWMRGGRGCFEEMALEVFLFQFAENVAYRNYCKALARTPETVKSWLEIPAVPTDAFKLPDISLRCFPESEAKGFFLTSGTTREVKGKHEYRDLQLYAASVIGGWREMGLPEIKNPWFFSQRTEYAPHSSLVNMFQILDQAGRWLINADGQMDDKKFQPEGATQILGTSLALLRFCDQTQPIQLSGDSWIFETGGSKGLRESHSPEQVRQQLAAHFGLPENRILNEYGMTELFSQFYKWGDETSHKGSPWVGIRVVDVFSGKPAETGEVGYLEIVDLANLDSVAAIRTQDLAIATGEREFVLLGRDPSAVARGCSRGVDDILKKR